MDKGLYQTAPPDSMTTKWIFRNTLKEPYDDYVKLCYFRDAETPLERLIRIWLDPGEEVEMILKIKTGKLEDTGMYTHKGIFCDVCRREVTGCRYKCGNCRDYDHCEACETLTGVHDPSHTFLKIPRPLPPQRQANGEYTRILLPCQLSAGTDDDDGDGQDATGKLSLRVKRWEISNIGSQPITNLFMLTTKKSNYSDVTSVTVVSLGKLGPAAKGRLRVTLHVPQQPGQVDNRHHGVGCGRCNCFPIVGVRYKCGNCPDYDLCEECEALDTHDPDHVFMKIRRGLSHLLANMFDKVQLLKKVLYGENPVPSACAPEVAAQSPPTGDTTRTMCVICWTSTRDTAFLPCGHRHFCHPCAQRFYETSRDAGCPTCRNPIDDVQKIYD